MKTSKDRKQSKLTVRSGMFETNSSSMHSLVIAREPKPYTEREKRLDHYYKTGPLKLENEYFHLFGEWEDEDKTRYGRSPFRVLRTPLEKLRYYVAGFLGGYDYDAEVDEVAEIPIKKFISRQTGIPEANIKIRTYDRDEPYGVVERNDTGESPIDFIKERGISMEEFVLNPKYIVVIDGDEYQEFMKLFESRLLTVETVEDISSGYSWWSGEDERFYMSWIKYGDKQAEYCIKNFVDDNVNQFLKTVTVEGFHPEESDRSLAEYIGWIEKLKKLTLEKNPAVKFRLVDNNWWDEEKLTGEDWEIARASRVFDDLVKKDAGKGGDTDE